MAMDEKIIKKMMDTLKGNPKDASAFKTLEEQYFLSHNWKKLSELYQFRADAIKRDDPNESARLFFKSGEIHEKRLGSKEEAANAYQNAFAVQPRKKEYGETLANLYWVDENWQKALEILKKQLEYSLAADQQVPILLKMAYVLKERVQNKAEAKKYLLQAIQLDVRQQEARRSLEEMYYQDKEWAELIELYQNSLKTIADPVTKSKILTSCASLAKDQLQDIGKAAFFYTEMLKISPQDMNVLKNLEELYLKLQQWNYAIDVLGRQANLTPSPQEKARILMQMAVLWSEKLNNLNEGVRHYEKALELYEDQTILKILEDIYSYQKEWRKLTGIYQRQCKLIQDDESLVDFYCKIGSVAKEKLNDLDMAIKWYQAAYQKKVGNLELLKALQDLLKQQGYMDELIKSYRQEIALSPEDGEKISIYERIIEIYQKQKKIRETASVYEEILKQFPGHHRSIQELKALYLMLEDYPQLILTMQREIALHPSSLENIPLYLKIAEVLIEKMGKEEEAIVYYHKAIELDASLLEVWNKLYEYYKRMERYPSLIQTLEHIVRLDPRREEEGLVEIAALYFEKLRDLQKAIESFLRVLKVNSHNLIAINALSSIYKSQKAWDAYIDIMQKRVALCMQTQEMIDLRFSLLEAYEQTGNQARQEHELVEILKMQFDHKNALEKLKSLYEKQKNWTRFVQILQKETEIFPWEQKALISLYKQIADLYETQLKARETAIYYYEKARHLDPCDLGILDTLERLYTETTDYKNIVKILEIKAGLFKEDVVVNTFYYQISTIWEEKLQNEEESIRALEKIVESDAKNIPALRRLERLYEAKQKYDRLNDVYRKQAQVATEKEQKVALYLKCGRISEEKLVAPDQALRFYLEVIQLAHDNPEALDRLLKIYRQQEKWGELAAIYAKKIAVTADKNEIVHLSFELASLYRQQLNDPNDAIKTYHGVLKLQPSNMEAIHALKELYYQIGQYGNLEKVLRAEWELSQDKEKKKSLCIQMGEICEEKLFDLERAIAHYITVLDYAPDHFETIRALKRLYYKTKNFERVVWSIDKECEITSLPEEKTSLFFEKAELCASRLLVFQKAIESYEKIIALDPNNSKAYQALITIYRQENEHKDLVDTLARYIAICQAEKQKELLVECAKVWESHLKNDDQAKQALRKALQLDIAHYPARRQLRAIHRRLHEWNELIAMYQEEISFVRDPKRLCEIHYELGKVWEVNLGKNEEALGCYQKVLELEPNNLCAIKSMQKIYHDNLRFEELLGSYQKELAVPEIEQERRIALNILCAELQRYRLEDIDSAIKSYLAVLDFQLDPNNLPAIRGLEELYEQKEQYRELQNMLFKELELQKDSNRLIAVHLQLATIMEEKLDNMDVAIEHFSEAHLSRPGNLPILRRLKRLLWSHERWPFYAEIVEKEIALCSTVPDLVPLHEDLVDVYDGHLKQFDKAIVHAEQALSLRAENIPLVRKLESLYEKTEQTTKLIETYLKEAGLCSSATESDRIVHLYMECGKLFSSALGNLPQAAECYQKVLQLDPTNKEALPSLVKILTNLKQWEKLIKLYELAAQITRNSTEAETLYFRIGELWEREFQDDSKALLSYQIVYTMNDKNYNAVTGMRRIFERQQRWGDAIEFLNKEVYLVEEKKQPPLFLKMGELWEEKLGMPHQSLTCYLKVMGHGFHRPTAERIMAIQKQVGDYQGLSEILEKDIRFTEKPEELIPKLLQLGKIQWQNLDHVDDAIETYSKVLKLDEKQMEALDALQELLTMQKKWKQLLTVLTRKKDNLNEPDKLLEVISKIGEIQDTRLHSGNLAIRYYERALELAPHDLELIHTLQRLYQEWGQAKKLIALYQKETQLIEEKEKIVSLWKKIGEVWEKVLFEDEQAIKAYERLLELDSDNIHAVRALARLYKRYQSWTELISVYEILIADAHKNNDSEKEIHFLLELGNVYRYEVNDAEAAIEAFGKVLQIDPAHKIALQSLEELYNSLGKPLEMANLITQKLATCHTDQERLELYIHLGMLYEKELDDPDHAIESFNYALSLDNSRLDVLKALDWLYMRKKNWEKLAETCEKEIRIASDLKEKAELCYRLGIIKRDRFQDIPKAKQLFLEAIDYEPDMRKALKALTGLAIMEENWTQAVKYIAMEINHIKEPSEKVEALTDLGSLYQNKLKLIQKAKETFQMSLDIDPKSPIATEAMADIHFDQGEFAKAEPLFGRLILLVDKAQTAKLSNIYYKWGTIAEKLGRKDEAIIRYSTSLDIQSDNLESLIALGALYFERAQWGFDKAQWQEALDVYERVFQHPNLDEEKVDVIKRLAVIQSNLGQVDAAIANYRKVLAEIPDNIESITSLAKLHIGKGEDEQALKYLQMIVKSESSSFMERRSALLSIGDAYTRLKRPQDAVDTYLKAFGMGIEDPSILKKIGEGYILLQNWNGAYEWIDKHYTCLEEAEQKVENRCLMAKIMMEGSNKPEDAIRMYKSALEIDSTWIPAIRGIAEIYERQEKWDIIAQEYRDFLEKVPQNKRSLALPIHLSLGALYHQRLKDNEAAIKEYNKALELDSNHIAAHAALAEIKSEDPLLHEDSIREHVFLLKKEAFRVASYRGLYKLFSGREQKDHALRACRALSVLGSLSEKEKQFLQSFSPSKMNNLDPESLVWYMIPNRGGVSREILALTEEHMVKVYAADIEQKYGLKRKERIVSVDQNKVWSHVQKICPMLGIAELDLYINPKKTHRIFIENTQPVSLLISQSLLDELSESETRFLLIKHLFYIAQKQTLAFKLDEKELQKYFQILNSTFVGPENSYAPEDEPLVKKIRSYIPRKLKKTLSERPDLWSALAKEEVSAYLKWVEFGSNRCALLLCDSLELTVQMIYRLQILQQSGKLVKFEKIALQDLSKIEAIHDILLYNISDEYGKLRKAAGIAF